MKKFKKNWPNICNVASFTEQSSYHCIAVLCYAFRAQMILFRSKVNRDHHQLCITNNEIAQQKGIFLIVSIQYLSLTHSLVCSILIFCINCCCFFFFVVQSGHNFIKGYYVHILVLFFYSKIHRKTALESILSYDF